MERDVWIYSSLYYMYLLLNCVAAAEKILEINGTIATMSNVQGTALHLLARQDRFYTLSNWKIALNLIVFDADAYWRGKGITYICIYFLRSTLLVSISFSVCLIY